MHVFHERLSICMSASFPFGFEGGMYDLIVLVLNHCPFLTFEYKSGIGYFLLFLSEIYV